MVETEELQLPSRFEGKTAGDGSVCPHGGRPGAAHLSKYSPPVVTQQIRVALEK